MVEDRAARCRRLRRRILDVARRVPAAHVAPAFSCLEIVDVLYRDVMRPQDLFIMSKGHGCLAQYAVLEDLGRLPSASLDNFCRRIPDQGSDDFLQLGGHPSWDPGAGIQASTGSLGHGLGLGVGMALAERLLGRDTKIYVLVSDGECQEGSTWEAVMVAANLRLGNLTAVVDFNGWGGMERMESAFPALAPITNKFRAFGWWCPSDHYVDGHDVSLCGGMISRLRYGGYRGMPAAVVCRTIKGKGVSLIEAGMPGWHYRSPTDAEYEQAVEELR